MNLLQQLSEWGYRVVLGAAKAYSLDDKWIIQKINKVIIKSSLYLGESFFFFFFYFSSFFGPTSQSTHKIKDSDIVVRQVQMLCKDRPVA